MPIHSGADNIDRLKIGSVVIASAYVGADKVYGYDPLQILTLTSSEDLNLATWLGAQGADPAKPIIISFASDQVIGGTIVDKPALDLGDLSGYSGITFNVNGKILGRVAGDAVWAQDPIDIINGGAVSGVIEEGAGTGATAVTFVIGSTGEIRAGGGDGGAGGKGGNGSDVSWAVPFTIIKSGDRHTHGWGTSPDMSTWWGNVAWNVYSGSPGWVYWFASAPDGNDIWARGAWEGVPGSHWYEIRYGNHTNGSGGAGGGAGAGVGYNKARTDGSSGAGGTYRSGNGGRGGDGGDWGVSGGDGAQGGRGLFYNTSSSSNVRAGAAGSAGAAAGSAFVSSSVILVSGT